MEIEKRFAGMIESFLFIIGEEGLTIEQLSVLTNRPFHEIEETLAFLQGKYDNAEDSGITLKVFGDAYRLVTKAEFADDMKKMLENPSPKSMTQASLEVLAIIAYKQPVTRVEIDDLRGVKSEGPIHTLAAKGLIREAGRSEGTGRAILYATTDLFLDRFGLQSLQELPPLQEDDEEEQEDTDLFMTKFHQAFSIEEEGGPMD